MSETKSSRAGLTRRSFLKTTGVVAGAAALTGATGSIALASEENKATSSQDVVTTTICRADCTQGCLYKVYTRDGVVRKLEPAHYETEAYTGCCLRGLSMVERTYSENRIKYPLRRVGERGSGEWERISWDDALSEIADNIKAVQDRYGKPAFCVLRSTGNFCMLNGGSGFVTRFSNAVQASYNSGKSADQAFIFAGTRMFGGPNCNEPADARNSKNILVWGANPVWSAPQDWRCFLQCRKNGGRITVIDPVFTPTASKADKYIPIKRQGRDFFIAMALINKVITEQAYDSAFCAARTTAACLVRRDNGKLLRTREVDGGKADYSQCDYVVWNEREGAPAAMGACETPLLFGSPVVNGVECDTVMTLLEKNAEEYTFERVSEECGISEDDLDELYRIFACGEPVWLVAKYGIDHYWNGHQWAIAAGILFAITGNIGKPGASFGNYGTSLKSNPAFTSVGDKKITDLVAPSTIREVIASGKWKNEDFPIRALMIIGSNTVSNEPDQKWYLNEVLPKLDFIVTAEIEMTDSARYSDIVVPISFWLEHQDARMNSANPYIAISEKAIDNLYESKTDFEFLTALGRAMGLEEDIPEKNAEEWLELIMDSEDMAKQGIDYDTLRQKGSMRMKASAEKPFVVFDEKFATKSTWAELYCETPVPRTDYGQDYSEYIEKEHLPYWEENLEIDDDSLAAKYPIQFLQVHTRWTTHSQWSATETFLEVTHEPTIYLGDADADERGIADGDMVRVFNDRGSMKVRCLRHGGLQKGTSLMPKGWQRHQYKEGSYQELTTSKMHPISANYPFYDVRVEIEKEA